MKKLVLILVAVFGFTLYGHSQFQFGAGASLVLDGTHFGIQGKALYDATETLKGSGAFTYYLESDGFSIWTIDLDVHYKLMEIGDGIQLNPFAGLEIARFSFDTPVNIPGVPSGDTQIGINLGASFIIPAGESLEVYAEPKIVLEGVSSFVLTGGILF